MGTVIMREMRTPEVVDNSAPAAPDVPPATLELIHRDMRAVQKLVRRASARTLVLSWITTIGFLATILVLVLTR